MKLSLKLRDADDHHNHHRHRETPLLRAKIPITIFNLPFLSGVSAGDPSDLSFNLRTNFHSGPSLQLSYHPTATATTTTAAAAAAATTAPFTISLKSGIGVFGSARNSPLIITANFNLFPNPNPNPSFTLQIKPQFGDFSLKKTTVSASNPNPNPNFDFSGFVIDKPMLWSDLSLDSCNETGFLSGIGVMARTGMPITKNLAVKCRWGVNFPQNLGKGPMKLPFLTVNKIGIERIVDENEGKKVKSVDGNVGDFEVLKGICFWMKKDLESMQKENFEMKKILEDMRFGVSSRNIRGVGDYNGNTDKPLNLVESSSGFEQWRSKKKGGEENGGKEVKKATNRASDVESELERAIKAASSSQ